MTSRVAETTRAGSPARGACTQHYGKVARLESVLHSPSRPATPASRLSRWQRLDKDGTERFQSRACSRVLIEQPMAFNKAFNKNNGKTKQRRWPRFSSGNYQYKHTKAWGTVRATYSGAKKMPPVGRGPQNDVRFGGCLAEGATATDRPFLGAL